MKRFKRKSQSGQAALIVLLIMAASLGLGLGVSKQTVVDTALQEQEKLSDEAFLAAESGIEYVWDQVNRPTPTIIPNYVYGTQGTGVWADVGLETLGDGESSFYHLDWTGVGQAAVFWLREHLPQGEVDESQGLGEEQVRVCWEKGFTGAFGVNYFYKDGSGVYQVYRRAFDTDAVRASINNGFTPLAGGVSCNQSGYEGWSFDLATVVGALTPLALVVVPYYETTVFGLEVLGGATLPSQGYEMRSVGKVAEVNQGVRAVYGWPLPPQYLLEGVFSGGNIQTN